MAKIVRFDHVGGPEVLQFKEEPSKQPGKGEVRLKVKAVGLNRAESMFMHGQYVESPKFPAGLGYEAAGAVEAVGPDVDKSWLGKSVSVIPAFSMSEYAMLGEEAIRRSSQSLRNISTIGWRMDGSIRKSRRYFHLRT
jgi:NADPH:quinone reductase-like Zn-dependent oxidoreductase